MNVIEQDTTFSPQYVVEGNLVHATIAIKENDKSPVRHAITYTWDSSDATKDQRLIWACKQVSVVVAGKARKLGISKFKQVEKVWTNAELMATTRKSSTEKTEAAVMALSDDEFARLMKLRKAA